MKMAEANRIMSGANKTFGFMVHFEHVGGGLLKDDCFPDKHAGETLIETVEEAWVLADLFAKKTKGKCVNIYVIEHNFSRVIDYRKRDI